MIKKIIIISMSFLIIACETTRQIETGNIGSSTQSHVKSGFDKINAAEKRVGYGLTYINAHNYLRAKFHLDKAFEYNPDSGNVHYALGVYFQRINSLKKSEEHFKKSLSIDDNKPEYLNAYAAFLCEKGDFKKADKLFMEAINILTYSDVASAFYNIGLCSLKQNNIEKADEYFRKSLNRDRRRPGALIEMAKIEFTKKRYERTLSYIQRFEQNTKITSESAWLALKAAHFLRDKDSIAKYGLILERRFPDSEETAQYLDNKKQWM